MLELFTSFGLCDDVGGYMLFNSFFTNFIQALVEPGPPVTKPQQDAVKSYWVFNAGFGVAEFYHSWAAIPGTMGATMSLQFATSSGTSSGELVTDVQDWFRFVDPSGYVVMTLRTAGLGQMHVVSNSGSIVGVLTYSFHYDTWMTFEVKSGSAGWEVRVNGVTVGQSPSPIDTVQPDRCGFRRQGFGPPAAQVANYVLWDDRAGDGFTDFIGPCWVSTLPVKSDVNAVSTVVPGPGIYTALRDSAPPFGTDPNGSPDGDASYVEPGTVSPPQLFTVGQPGSPCFGLVLAVGVMLCARPIGVDQLVSFFCRPKQMIHELGSVTLSPSGTQYSRGFAPAKDNYRTYQLISTLSPESGFAWQDAEIANAQWGYAPASTENTEFRATQFYVVKLTTLDATKGYSCGGGPYVY